MATRRSVLSLASAGLVGGSHALAASAASRRPAPDDAVEAFYAPLRGADPGIYLQLLHEDWRCTAGSLRFGADRASQGPAVRLFLSMLAGAEVQLHRRTWSGDSLWVEGCVRGRAAGDVRDAPPHMGGATDAAPVMLEFVDLHLCARGRIVATRHYERPSPVLLHCSHRLGSTDEAWLPLPA